MMTKTRVLWIALAAFWLGFATNQYFNSKTSAAQQSISVGAASLQSSRLVEEPSVINSSTNDVAHPANGFLSQNEAAIKTATTAGSSSSVSNSQSVVTLEQILQQMNNMNYSEAVHLIKTYLKNHEDSAQAWNLLAQAYQKLSQPQAALDAWFRYLNLEIDPRKMDSAIKDIKNYLSDLSKKTELFNNDFSWLISQYDELIKRKPNDGDTHLVLAELYLKQNDNYQAQYHALMASNDPAVQKRAQKLLAKLNNNVADEINIPLVRSGNQYIVNAFIEGNPVRFLVDTGASISGLTRSYTQKFPALVKDKKPIAINSAGGTYNTVLFTVDNVTIESLVFNQQILAQLTLFSAPDFDGLLGVDILGRFDFVIDQDANILHVKARNN